MTDSVSVSPDLTKLLDDYGRARHTAGFESGVTRPVWTDKFIIEANEKAAVARTAIEEHVARLEAPLNAPPVSVSPDLTKLLNRLQGVAEHLSISRLSMSMGAVKADEKELLAASTAIEEYAARLEETVKLTQEAFNVARDRVVRLEAQVTELSRIERELLQSKQDAMDFYEAELARLTALWDKEAIEVSKLRAELAVRDEIDAARLTALPPTEDVLVYLGYTRPEAEKITAAYRQKLVAAALSEEGTR